MSENSLARPTASWLGIDLGTTNTVAAFYNQQMCSAGSVDLIYINDSAKNTIMDSTVFYNSESEEILVGTPATRQRSIFFENTISDSKRLMGLAYCDEGVREFQTRMRQYKIVNSEGYAAFEISHNREIIRQTAVDIAAKVLKKMREAADLHHGSAKFENAVIAVPICFGQEARIQTINAAKLAGFTKVHLINEPNAAAYFSGFRNQRFDGYTMLIFDFGGGTLDVSILKVQNEEFNVLAQQGKKWLGGRDFDEAIRKEMVKQIKAKFGYDCAKHCGKCSVNCGPDQCRHVKRIMQILLERCEQLKIDLSAMQKSNLSLDFIGEDGHIQISRDEYEKLVNAELKEVIGTVNEAMMEAKLDADGIGEVHLTGGSSSTPILVEMFEGIGFTREKIKIWDPNHSVAKGAAILGAQFDEQARVSLPKTRLNELCPLSIGIRSHDDLFIPIIHRTSVLPTVKEHKFWTTHNDEQSMLFELYEGERKLAEKNNFLNSFTIYHLSKGAAGSVSVKVKLSIDKDGILHAEAFHKDLSYAIMNTNYLEKHTNLVDVNEKIRQAEMHRLDDAEEEKRIRKKFDFIEVVERTKYKCIDATILKHCANYENWIKENDNATYDEFCSAMKRFQAIKQNTIENERKKLRMRTPKIIRKHKE